MPFRDPACVLTGLIIQSSQSGYRRLRAFLMCNSFLKFVIIWSGVLAKSAFAKTFATALNQGKVTVEEFIIQCSAKFVSLLTNNKLSGIFSFWLSIDYGKRQNIT